MIIKLTGVFLVFISSSLIGIYFSGLDSYRINDLTELRKAMCILKSEIEFTSAPLAEAFHNIAQRLNKYKPLRHVFFDAAEKLQNHMDISVFNIWMEVVNKHKRQCYFSEEDLDNLIAFGKTIGYLDKNMQVSSIEHLNGYIDDKVAVLKEHHEKTSKMYKSLGVLFGLLIVVVFI